MWFTDIKNGLNQNLYNNSGKISSTEVTDNEKNSQQTMPKTALETNTGVTLTISEEAKEMNSQGFIREQLERMRESSEKSEETTADMAKIMEIARRISNGDKVPYSDEKKLMEYSFKLYQIAKSAAMLNKNEEPKEYEALFEDDGEKSKEEMIRALDRGGSSLIDSSSQTTSGEEACEISLS